MAHWKRWFIALFGVLVLVVLAQNSATVTLRLLFWEARLSQLVLTVITFLAGGIFGFGLAKLTGRRDPA